MTYNDAVLRRLRDGLLHYRSANRINGRKRKWERIAEDMLEAPTTSRGYRMNEADYLALGEALRRFTAGGQTLGTARLDVLTAFLKGVAYDVGGGDDEAALPPALAQSLHRAFSGDSDPEAFAIKRIAGTFFATRSPRKGNHHIAFLQLAPQPDGLLGFAESVFEVAAKPTSRDPIALRRMARVTALKRVNRDGWVFGFKSTLVLACDRASGACEHKIIAGNVGYRFAAPSGESTDKRIHTLIVVDSGVPGPGWTTTIAGSPESSPDEALRNAEALATGWITERLWLYKRYAED